MRSITAAEATASPDSLRAGFVAPGTAIMVATRNEPKQRRRNDILPEVRNIRPARPCRGPPRRAGLRLHTGVRGDHPREPCLRRRRRSNDRARPARLQPRDLRSLRTGDRGFRPRAGRLRRRSHACARACSHERGPASRDDHRKPHPRGSQRPEILHAARRDREGRRDEHPDPASSDELLFRATGYGPAADTRCCDAIQVALRRLPRAGRPARPDRRHLPAFIGRPRHHLRRAG